MDKKANITPRSKGVIVAVVILIVLVLTISLIRGPREYKPPQIEEEPFIVDVVETEEDNIEGLEDLEDIGEDDFEHILNDTYEGITDEEVEAIIAEIEEEQPQIVYEMPEGYG